MATLTEFLVVTPAALKFSGKAEIVVAPGAAGDFAALAQHAPMLSTMRVGVLRATVAAEGAGADAAAGKRVEFAVNGGFVQVLPNKVIALTDLALSADEINVNQARADLKRASEALAQKRGADEDVHRRDVAWAQARIDVTHKPVT